MKVDVQHLVFENRNKSKWEGELFEYLPNSSVTKANKLFLVPTPLNLQLNNMRLIEKMFYGKGKTLAKRFSTL